MNFPYDWLSPGEIKYCKCGYRLLAPGDRVCWSCDPEGRTPKNNLWEAALALATSRRESGVKQLFWMDK